MAPPDFITAWFCRLDDPMPLLTQHPQAGLWPREVVTLGDSARPEGDRQPRVLPLGGEGLSPAVSPAGAKALVSPGESPSSLEAAWLGCADGAGGVDTYGLELIPPIREGRHPTHIGRQGRSNPRWRVGGKLGGVLGSVSTLLNCIHCIEYEYFSLFFKARKQRWF